MFGQHWIQIAASDYVVDLSIAQDGTALCKIRIKQVDLPFNIMGMPAFLGYYVTHSWEMGQASMTFAPHQDSLKPKLEKG